MKVEDLGTLKIGKRYYLVFNCDIRDLYILSVNPLKNHEYIIQEDKELKSVRCDYYKYNHITDDPKEADILLISIIEPWLNDLKEMIKNERNY